MLVWPECVLWCVWTASCTSTTRTAARGRFCSARPSASVRCWRKTSPWFCRSRLTCLLSSMGWPVKPLQSATVVLKHSSHSHRVHLIELPSVTDHLIFTAASHSACIFPYADLLLDCLELCKSTRSAADVYRQCQIEDFGFFAKVSLLNVVYAISTPMTFDQGYSWETWEKIKNHISVSLGWMAILLSISHRTQCCPTNNVHIEDYENKYSESTGFLGVLKVFNLVESN